MCWTKKAAVPMSRSQPAGMACPGPSILGPAPHTARFQGPWTVATRGSQGPRSCRSPETPINKSQQSRARRPTGHISPTSSGGSSSRTRNTNPEEAWLPAAHQGVSQYPGYAGGYWEALSSPEGTPWTLRPNQPAQEPAERHNPGAHWRQGGRGPSWCLQLRAVSCFPTASHPARGNQGPRGVGAGQGQGSAPHFQDELPGARAFGLSQPPTTEHLLSLGRALCHT